MRKLIGGKYVPVEVLTQEADADQANFADVLEGDDIEAMDKEQLIDFLQTQGISANKRWKEETLRGRALSVVKG